MLNNFHLISDFNIEPLKGFLLNRDKKIEISVSPYGQVMQEIYKTDYNPETSIFIWTSAKNVIPTFSEALKFKSTDENICLKEVKSFSEAIIDLSKRQKYVFVASWYLENKSNNYGILDWKPGLGISNLIAKMNLSLAELLSKRENIFIFNSDFWMQNTEKVIPKIWYATKVPYSQSVYKNVSETLFNASKTLIGQSKKIIILDLDNTLWGGVIGELGVEGISLGGHDIVGESHREFQENLLNLSNKGIQLSIVSKNDESTAFEAIDNHDQMILKRKNFAGWRINWQDKVTNIKSLMKELNLGLSSAVFIDDNPVERDWVRKSLPEVLVPEWPSDSTLYVEELSKLNCFDTISLSKEDRERTKMYVAERQRKEVKENTLSINEWLKSLETKVIIHKLDKTNINRVTQLFNKTNQLNLKTRRLSQEEIVSWVNKNKDNRMMYIIEVKDKLGDLGLVGIISLEAKDKVVNIEDYILSCRAMGRKIEEFMHWLAIKYAKDKKVDLISAELIPTKKNRPTYDIFKNSIFKNKQDNIFEAKSNVNIEPPKELFIDSNF